MAKTFSKRKKYNSKYNFTWKKMGSFFKIIFDAAKDHPLLFSIMIIATTIDAVVAVLLPVAASNITKLLSNISSNSSSGTTLPETNSLFGITMHWESWIYVCLIIFAACLVIEYLTNITIGIFSVRVEISQRNKILISLVNQDVDFFFDNVSGNIMTRLVGDTQGLAMGIQQFLSNLIYCLAMFVTATIIVFSNNYGPFGLISLLYSLFVILFAIIIFIRFRSYMIKMFDYKRVIDADMTDRISNITLIKSSGMEEYELNRNEKHLEKYNKRGNKVVTWSANLNLWVSVSVSFATTLMIIIAAVMIVNDKNLSVMTNLSLILQMVGYMGLPVILITPTLRSAARASNCAGRIGELTDPVPNILPNKDGPKLKKIDSIEFKNVSFAYPKKKDKIIIPDMNLKFEHGKSYAFVGETGSGKSTIGRLLLRYYQPIDGKIIINDKYDLEKVNLPSYLDLVGYVEQDPQIFFGNFIDNIRYGKFDATREEVVEACKKAELHDFIMSLPDGYETMLGQRGFLLSGGQKQRLVIARVFLKNPDLIILDEATSALDNVVEKEIQSKLNELIKGKTSITIAHRLSTIKDVDEIIVLGMGKGIVQIGSFDELIKKEGHFKRLYEAGEMK